jgi:hypothetical protein
MIRKKLTRGVVVLHKNLSEIGEELRDRDMHVITYDSKMDMGVLKHDYLPGRILITTKPADFVWDASSYCYGILDISKIKTKNPKTIASLISKVMARYKLWERSKRSGWIMVLNNQGTGKIRALED